MIDTAKVTDRRQLRFNSIDEVLADVDRIVASGKAGTLRHTGNWTPGQAMGHVAAWINYGYDGFPMKPPPWPIRIILKVLVKGFLKNGLRPGVKIPGAKEGTYGTEQLSIDEGAAHLRTALMRLKNGEPAKFDSPGLGFMSEANRIKLTLRHAQLHLSFMHP